MYYLKINNKLVKKTNSKPDSKHGQKDKDDYSFCDESDLSLHSEIDDETIAVKIGGVDHQLSLSGTLKSPNKANSVIDVVLSPPQSRTTATDPFPFFVISNWKIINPPGNGHCFRYAVADNLGFKFDNHEAASFFMDAAAAAFGLLNFPTKYASIEKRIMDMDIPQVKEYPLNSSVVPETQRCSLGISYFHNQGRSPSYWEAGCRWFFRQYTHDGVDVCDYSKWANHDTILITSMLFGLPVASAQACQTKHNGLVQVTVPYGLVCFDTLLEGLRPAVNSHNVHKIANIFSYGITDWKWSGDCINLIFEKESHYLSVRPDALLPFVPPEFHSSMKKLVTGAGTALQQYLDDRGSPDKLSKASSIGFFPMTHLFHDSMEEAKNAIMFHLRDYSSIARPRLIKDGKMTILENFIPVFL